MCACGVITHSWVCSLMLLSIPFGCFGACSIDKGCVLPLESQC